MVLDEEGVDGEHPPHVLRDLVDEQAVEHAGGDVGEPRPPCATRGSGAPVSGSKPITATRSAPSASAGAIGVLSRVPPST